MNCVHVRSGCEVDAWDDGHYQETHTQDTHRSAPQKLYRIYERRTLLFSDYRLRARTVNRKPPSPAERLESLLVTIPADYLTVR